MTKKDEILYNVGNVDRKELMEEFPPMGGMRLGMGMKRKPDPMAALEVESNILKSITELGRNIKNMEYRIRDMQDGQKEKLFNSIKEKLAVLEDVLKDLNPTKAEEKEEKEEEKTEESVLEEGTFTMKIALDKIIDGMYNVRIGLGMFRVGGYGKKDPQKREALIEDVNKGLKEIKERLDKI